MAKVAKNQKGFLALEISREELIDKFGRYGALGVCDHCVRPASVGYYVAVLNHWLCPDCYDDFVKTADRYKEDESVEIRNFKRYSEMFNVTA